MRTYIKLTCLLCMLLASANASLGNENSLIKINDPLDGSSVSNPISINGTVNGDLPSDRYMWILINPLLTPGLFWPQGDDHVTPLNGQFRWIANLGGSPGEEANIIVVLVDKKTNDDFISWVDANVISGRWPGLRIPDNAKIIDSVTVRKV
jgi:hypothetical protein